MYRKCSRFVSLPSGWKTLVWLHCCVAISDSRIAANLSAEGRCISNFLTSLVWDTSKGTGETFGKESQTGRVKSLLYIMQTKENYIYSYLSWYPVFLKHLTFLILELKDKPIALSTGKYRRYINNFIIITKPYWLRKDLFQRYIDFTDQIEPKRVYVFRPITNKRETDSCFKCHAMPQDFCHVLTKD